MSFAGTVFGLPLAREVRGKFRHCNSGFQPIVLTTRLRRYQAIVYHIQNVAAAVRV